MMLMWNQVRSGIAAGFLALLGAALVAVAPALADPGAQTLPATDALAPATPHALTKADADAWLDGLVPYALEKNDIAGAVVVIVKDGRVLTERGFGYADVAARKPVDPAATLFRPGSISKLFTWTAVMQQVERGKIDLDADINTYLDFKIPPYRGRPVTMRDLMTHTAGFGDVVKGGYRSTGAVPPLGAVVKRMLPKRIFAPGTTPAYSNYGAALAGYVVQRVSGLPFDTYVEREIFQPLGMAHSSFRQPLPANLLPLMAKGYETASDEAKPFELISVPPAGSASISGDDMAKFMIAHLNQGAGLLRPETAQHLHDPNRVVLPGLNRMALGFYEQRVNGLSAIGHGGDLQYFHSYLWLLPDQKVGVYLSVNSAGVGEKTFPLRLAFFQAFGDRYHPRPVAAPVELPSAKADAKLLAGHYSPSRGAFTNFLDVADFLGQLSIKVGKDGRPVVPNLFGGPPRRWIEVSPFLWQDAYGPQRLAAKVGNGKVVRWSIDSVAPFMVWDRTPWYRNTAWLMPAFGVGLITTLITALAWPAGAIARRIYGARLALSGRELEFRRLNYGLAWLVTIILAGWFVLLKVMFNTEANLDAWIWGQELGGAVAFVGLPAVALWGAGRAWATGPGWAPRVWRTLHALGALSILWVAVAFHLVSFGAAY